MPHEDKRLLELGGYFDVLGIGTGEAHSVAIHGVALGHAGDDDGASVGVVRQRALMRLVEDDLAVDLVGQHPQIMALGQGHEFAH